MTDYYISSINGSDEHTGFESSTPWKSFSILNTLDLEAGDRIFLEAGSVFNDTLELVDDYGNKDQPIIFSTYGEGSAPRIISDTGSGILAARSKHVVVENIEIGPTVNSGIEARDSDFWTIRNVSITDAGGEDRNFGSINWKDSNDLIFENNTILDSYGDGIYLSNVDGVVIKDNYIEGTHSRDADNIQITGTDVVIENNILINGLNDVTTKGNIVFHGENLFLGDNYLEGGSFGISTSADQVVIEDNVFKNHDKYSWSGGVVVSDAVTGDVFDGLVVKGNEFKDGSNGMSFYGASETKYSSDILTIQDINISDNLFLIGMIRLFDLQIQIRKVIIRIIFTIKNMMNITAILSMKVIHHPSI